MPVIPANPNVGTGGYPVATPPMQGQYPGGNWLLQQLLAARQMMPWYTTPQKQGGLLHQAPYAGAGVADVAPNPRSLLAQPQPIGDVIKGPWEGLLGPIQRGSELARDPIGPGRLAPTGGGGGLLGKVVQMPQKGQPPSNPYFGKYSNQPPASHESAVLQQQHMAKVQDAIKKLPSHLVEKIDHFSTKHDSSPYVRGNALIDAANMKAARQAWESYSGKNPDIMPPGMQYPQGKPPAPPPTDPGRGMLKDIIEGKMPGVTFTRGPENDPRMGPKSIGPVWTYKDQSGKEIQGRFENASRDGKTYHFRREDGTLDVLTGQRLRDAKGPTFTMPPKPLPGTSEFEAARATSEGRKNVADARRQSLLEGDTASKGVLSPSGIKKRAKGPSAKDTAQTSFGGELPPSIRKVEGPHPGFDREGLKAAMTGKPLPPEQAALRNKWSGWGQKQGYRDAWRHAQTVIEEFKAQGKGVPSDDTIKYWITWMSRRR